MKAAIANHQTPNDEISRAGDRASARAEKWSLTLLCLVSTLYLSWFIYRDWIPPDEGLLGGNGGTGLMGAGASSGFR
ncbi:MAG: hypothetical protein KDA38_16935 [Planctomycetales bacterium]|nr:hypothetical protein [Planctomycetales bacterium]